MKTKIQFSGIIFLLFISLVACKSKQQITEISGANIPASSTSKTDNKIQNIGKNTANDEAEVTRNENFSLASGQKSDALKFKYHVVVGSFKSQTNAKGLQEVLNNEGNRAIIVVNELGMFRVLIASYNEYPKARQRINDISGRFPDAWVLVQK